MPLDVVHRIDSGGTASHREVHNVFGMQNSRATYEGLLGLERNRRPFVLTRASYAGGQRFAASWTGDNSSTWNHYRISVSTLLSLGLSGYPIVGDDTLAEEASRTGVPLMRPLWLEHPETEIHPADVEDRVFLFGPDLLIEPKLDEMLEPLDVVVPPGVWYDYSTGERWLGTSKQKVRVGLGDLFVLVRGGAIVPHQPLVQSTGEVPKGPLELRVYLGPDCRGSLYMDDGVTFNYQNACC